MSQRLGVFGYVPPPRFPGAKTFLENITKCTPANELVLYSEHAEYNVITTKGNPEQVAGKDQAPDKGKWAVNNVVFSIAVRHAAKHGYSHMLYVEADCRFACKGWDSFVFDEYFRLPFPPVAAGSLVSHACVNGGGEFYKRFTSMIARNRTTNEHLIPIYGVPAPDEAKSLFPSQSSNIVLPGARDERYKPAVYPNGALGVYDVAWLCELFHINPDGSFKPGHDMVNDFVLNVAWDHVIGRRLYDRFGADVFNVVAHLKSVYSSYGDRLNTESERLQMLIDRKCYAVHQVKSNATI